MEKNVYAYVLLPLWSFDNPFPFFKHWAFLSNKREAKNQRSSLLKNIIAIHRNIPHIQRWSLNIHKTWPIQTYLQGDKQPFFLNTEDYYKHKVNATWSSIILLFIFPITAVYCASVGRTRGTQASLGVRGDFLRGPVAPQHGGPSAMYTRHSMRPKWPFSSSIWATPIKTYTWRSAEPLVCMPSYDALRHTL